MTSSRPWRRRVVQMTVGTAALIIVSVSWIAAYDLTPEDERPFVGSNPHNSMFELAIGHNALDRFVRHRRGLEQAAAAIRTAGPAAQPLPANHDAGTQAAGTVRYARENVPAGTLRLVDPRLASQIGWLFPLAAADLAIGAWQLRRRDRAFASLLLWSGWTLSCALVYSAAGGIFHSYYLLPMVPPLCALAGIDAANLLRLYRRGGRGEYILPLVLLVTALWQAYIEWGYLSRDNGVPADWRLSLYAVMLGGAALAIVGLTLAAPSRKSFGAKRFVDASAFSIGILTLLVTPAARGKVVSRLFLGSSVGMSAISAAPGLQLAGINMQIQPEEKRRHYAQEIIRHANSPWLPASLSAPASDA